MAFNNMAHQEMSMMQFPEQHLEAKEGKEQQPTWLTGALLRQQDSGQWLHRSANEGELPGSTSESMVQVGSGDAAKPATSGEIAVDSGEGWQNARYKAEILAHPFYEQLLSAHVACLRIATPVDQLPRIDTQLAQSQNVVAKYAMLGHHLTGGDDKELDQFMSHYVLLLYSFKEQLQQHVRVHAMEAVMACWELEQSLQSLTVSAWNTFSPNGLCNPFIELGDNSLREQLFPQVGERERSSITKIVKINMLSECVKMEVFNFT